MDQISDQARNVLSAQDLLAGSSIVHDIHVPPAILHPGADLQEDTRPGTVRMRPLNVATLAEISRAAREDSSLVPLLMIKQSMVEPALTLDRIRLMHIGLVHYLVGQINLISGLAADGDALQDAASAPIGRAHVLLAKHFGWTPQQVSQLTPAQVAIYLAGIEKSPQPDGFGK